jgi:hypothetical protein
MLPIPCRTVRLEKDITTEVALPGTQDLATCHYPELDLATCYGPELDQSSPRTTILFIKDPFPLDVP